jgi:nuclear transport factor 2 (NTF2) superfamily protein
MSQETVEIALQQVDAFNRRDVEGVVACASPKVEWEDSMFWTEDVRIYRGRAELREWVTRKAARGRPGRAIPEGPAPARRP